MAIPRGVLATVPGLAPVNARVRGEMQAYIVKPVIHKTEKPAGDNEDDSERRPRHLETIQVLVSIDHGL